MQKSYKELMPQIKTFIFDVDGVLTNGMITIHPNGELIRQMNIKDGYALKTAVNAGFLVCIISGGSNEGVRSRLKALGIEEIHLGVHQKDRVYQELLEKHKISSENTLYMGDDLPDHPVMKKVGFACAPSDAAPEIKEISQYISPKKGGEGCVRDVIEQVLRVQGKWKAAFDAQFD